MQLIVRLTFSTRHLNTKTSFNEPSSQFLSNGNGVYIEASNKPPLYCFKPIKVHQRSYMNSKKIERELNKTLPQFFLWLPQRIIPSVRDNRVQMRGPMFGDFSKMSQTFFLTCTFFLESMIKTC